MIFFRRFRASFFITLLISILVVFLIGAYMFIIDDYGSNQKTPLFNVIWCFFSFLFF